MDMANPKVEAFFASEGRWRAELAALRAILLDGPLTEVFKWRSPCYTFMDGNVATVWGFRDDCVLGFFKGVLLKDPAGILVPPGENSRAVRIVRFSSLDQIAGAEPLLKDYIHQAVEVEKAGLRVELPKDDLDLPDELIARLDKDPVFRAAFEALTPGRQRGYALHFSQPKQSATRVSRIEKCVPKIFAGKGMHDR